MPAPDDGDLALLSEAALAAGEVALAYWRRPLRSWEKPAGEGLVTEADLAVNDALRERLRGARPGWGWLSEEDADDLARLAAPAVFVVDPIDGTRAFAAGQDAFAVSLAIVRAGRVTAGVVHLPALGATYAAAADGTATRDGAPVAPSDRVEIEGARLLVPAAALAPAHWRGTPPAVSRQFRPSLAWGLCLVAEGRHDGVLTLRDTWEWDIAAGALIATRAGAAVSDRHGAALTFNAARPKVAGLLAAPPALHAALAAHLAP